MVLIPFIFAFFGKDPYRPAKKHILPTTITLTLVVYVSMLYVV